MYAYDMIEQKSLEPITSCDDYVVFYKPHGIPTVPLKSQELDGTLLSSAVKLFPEIMNICGKNSWEGGTIHRLDIVTAGLVLFARKQSFYDYIQNEQKENRFLKSYIANTIERKSLPGFPLFNISNPITSCFRAYGPGRKAVRPCSMIKSDSKKKYDTYIEKKRNNQYICKIYQGFRHQIRAHLAWAGHPIINDYLYGADDIGKGNFISLECFALSFDGEKIIYNYSDFE